MDGMSGAVSESLKTMSEMGKWIYEKDNENTEAAKLTTLKLPYLSISCYVR